MHNGIYLDKSKHIITHARCSIPPFVTEEVSFKQLSEKYKDGLVILGDIHSPVKDLPTNVYYTYEPTNNHFVKHKVNTKGYLLVDTATNSVQRIFPKLLYKDVLEFTSVREAEGALQLLKDDNLYKVIITAPIADFTSLNKDLGNVVFELVPEINIEQQEEEQELKELVNRKVSIEETLLQHTQSSYKFSLDTLNKVKNRLMRLR